MAVTAADVKRLRELTGAGMMDCKKALEEAEGDFEKAVEILRVKGAKGVNKRAERTASNGLVTSHIEGTSHGVLLELNCETDFVAKTEGFQQMAADVSAFVAAKQPADIAELLGLEIEADKTIQQLLDEANATMGEKIEIRRFERFSDGYVTVYLHKHDPALPPSVGALVETDVDNEEVAKNVAQHIAAMSPLYLSREDVPEDTVANERRIAEETAREEGKPEQALPKIVEGRVNGFFKDV
ncbi:MAG: translation elongation factor Ts, partial [Candidatus Nanopelagicales bacterium]|nr:translation elongation factor Ts [Candidatus Nanopelagicales bacterium]